MRSNLIKQGAGALLVTLVAVAGCDDGVTANSDVLAVELAEQAAVDAHVDSDHMRAPGVPGLRFPRSVPGVDDRPDCPLEAGVYVCVRERFGITTTYEVTFFDEVGETQVAFDDALTAAVRIQTSTTGDRSNDRVSGSVDRSRDMIVSGLLGDETSRTWNGTSEGESTRTRLQGDGAGESVTVMFSSVVTEVEIPLPSAENQWPLGGSVQTTLIVSGGPREGEHTATVTFDGTQFAVVEMDGEVFTVDLTTRRGRRGHHGHGG